MVKWQREKVRIARIMEYLKYGCGYEKVLHRHHHM